MIISKKKRAVIRRKTGGYCWYCGDDLSNGRFTIDHIQPRSRKGATKDTANMIPACEPCNTAKANMSLEEYRRIQDRKQFYGEKVGWKL